MAKQRRSTAASSSRREARGGGQRSGSAAAALLALAVVAAGGYLLYRHTTPAQRPAAPHTSAVPAATAAPPAPDVSPAPRQAVPAAHEPSPPFGESEDVFETGAKVYVAHCASCHGRPGVPSANASGAVQLWAPDNRAAAELPGTLYLKIANGVPATKHTAAMPGYGHILSDTQIWDLALLLHNAHGELPDPVLKLLREGSGKR